MAFAAGEQGRHAALLQALCHREQQAVGSTALLQTRVSEAALGSARLQARVASCLHGVSRPYSCCQANVGRFWRRSQRSSGQRASCHVQRTLLHELHRRNVIMCSVRGRWPPQAGRVKIIDFSKTTLLSCSQRADHGTLRGSASFALVHEKVWSKVNWLLDQVNLYGARAGESSPRPIVANVASQLVGHDIAGDGDPQRSDGQFRHRTRRVLDQRNSNTNRHARGHSTSLRRASRCTKSTGNHFRHGGSNRTVPCSHSPARRRVRA